MRRETYRRALSDGTDLHRLPPDPAGTRSLAHAQQRHPTHRPVPTRFPRSTLMRVLIEHPVLCALGVAAVVAIGPRRIMRTVATGATAAGALTARNQSNVDLLGKVLTMAGAYVQGRTDDQHQHS
ncbi:MAG TPA: hypothetical protein VEC01_06270 [Noviherbaspirillum sp.]|uniref:hypothetical protein n=1 Tax=Noviherbaspirillum sp. TaxID=1926288 RepID=UPI002D577B52|nr:hypothetical protein [Noviherbaspirillum sp.]HYD94912.1 hypothetical protein [Noviherbaspirillum sp.]